MFSLGYQNHVRSWNFLKHLVSYWTLWKYFLLLLNSHTEVSAKCRFSSRNGDTDSLAFPPLGWHACTVGHMKGCVMTLSTFPAPIQIMAASGLSYIKISLWQPVTLHSFCISVPCIAEPKLIVCIMNFPLPSEFPLFVYKWIHLHVIGSFKNTWTHTKGLCAILPFSMVCFRALGFADHRQFGF